MAMRLMMVMGLAAACAMSAAAQNAFPVAGPAVAAPAQEDAAPPPGRAGSEVEALPMAEAAAFALTGICLPALAGRASLADLLPPGAVEGADAVRDRLSGRPSPGRVWTLPSLDGPFLVGTIDAQPGACQIVVPNPFETLVAERLTQALLGAPDPFTLETAPADQGGGIVWSRYNSAGGVWANLVVYPASGGPSTATVHLTVG